MTDQPIITVVPENPFRPPVVLMGLLGVSLLWAYWPTLADMAGTWNRDSRYSHGFLVPAFALYLLWFRKEEARGKEFRPSWWGLPLIAAGLAMKFAAAYVYVAWFESLSLIPTLAGVAIVCGGWPALRWAGPSIAFLFFMMPLPYRVELTLGYPLQRIATLASTFALQTLGLPAVAEGNIILMNEARIGIVDACNGLGMLFMFIAFAVAATLVIDRPRVDKVVLILSAVPIAVLANITRITVTGLLYETAGGKVADVVYHDLAGWLMMPLALGALWAELWVLSRLLIEGAPGGGESRPLDLIGGPYIDPAGAVGRRGQGQRR